MKELICPLCQSPLLQSSAGLNCVNLHQFDRSRQGYYNLLPAQHKNSKQPGESKQQLQARRDFLAAGYFLPLAEKIVESISPEVHHYVDLGCGEGYFTFHLSRAFESATGYAVDISKAAIQLVAGSAPKNLTAIVASNFQLPFAKESVDLVTRILAPSIDHEIFRILKPQGRLIVVRPQGDHLIGLRKQIYSEVKPYQVSKIPKGFVLQSEVSVRFELLVNDALQIQNLMQMTPFAWRIKPEKLAYICAESWRDIAEFSVSVYQKAV